MHGGSAFFALLLICQNVFSKEIIKVHKDTDDFDSLDHHDEFNKQLMIIENRDRSIADIWNNIKNSAKIAWNSVKKLAENTKEKIKTLVKNVKDRAIAIAKSFEERLNLVKSKINGIIQTILDDENIKKCFQRENEAIKTILKDIVNRVSNCISNKINGLGALEDYKLLNTLLNETKFMEKIDAQLDMCKQSSEVEVEECLQNVRENILEETETIEAEVLETRIISRSFAEDILDAVITCATDGLIEASAVIANEILIIIKCITQVQP